MKNWLKTSLLTTVVLCAILFGLSYVLDFSINVASPNIEFAPGPSIAGVPQKDYPEKPKNIIVFIADGMGFSHLSLAMHTQQEENVPSVWNEFSVKGWHDPKCTYGPLTDSGASATAMATGTPTYWDVIGQDPDGNKVTNVMEVAQNQHYSTGIVTDSYIWDATAAAFYAHTKSRDSSRTILTQSASSNLDLLFGELEDVGEEGNPGFEETYNILKQRFELLDKSLDVPEDKSIPIAAIYNEDAVQNLNSSPNLTQLTQVALDRLVSKEKPFVLLVESEEMDAASHSNNSRRVIRGLKSIQSTLSLLMKFAEEHGETLVLFTADHETGGLAAVANFDNYPNMEIKWATKEHSGAVVPLLAKGPGAEYFSNIHENWEIGRILKGLISNN